VSDLVKICEYCGLDYRRPTGSQKVSEERWTVRRFCSSACGAAATGLQPGEQNPGSQATYDRYRVNAADGSAKLLMRIQSLYLRISVERGLRDEWEAACCVGMRA
jgi:hypothetical protein